MTKARQKSEIKRKSAATIVPTLQQCEAALKEPAVRWVGRCYEISCAIVKKRLFTIQGEHGEAVYGHWIGKIHPRSLFANRSALGCVQHGWIHFERNKVVVDPTRFVFESRSPYIYIGDIPITKGSIPCKNCSFVEDDHGDDDVYDACARYEPDIWPYDEGGNSFRAATRQAPPEVKGNDARIDLRLDRSAARYVGKLLGQLNGEKLTREQIFWLANLPYQTLSNGRDVRTVCAIYTALSEAGFIEFIPLDNRNKARREGGFSYK